MPARTSNLPPIRWQLGVVLILAGAALLGWVGLRLQAHERAQLQGRSELRSASERAALAVARPPAWNPDAVLDSGLEFPEPPALPVERPPRQASRGKKSQLIGRIVVPQVGIDTMAFEGIDLATLELGAGHFPGTPLPGRRGNASFSAHRNTDFRGLRDIQHGHLIYVETGASTYVYRVAETRVVEPEQVEVVASRGRDELTLITCHPFDWVGPAPRRFVVHADLVGTTPQGVPGASP